MLGGGGGLSLSGIIMRIIGATCVSGMQIRSRNTGHTPTWLCYMTCIAGREIAASARWSLALLVPHIPVPTLRLADHMLAEHVAWLYCIQNSILHGISCSWTMSRARWIALACVLHACCFFVLIAWTISGAEYKYWRSSLYCFCPQAPNIPLTTLFPSLSVCLYTWSEAITWWRSILWSPGLWHRLVWWFFISVSKAVLQ